MLQVCQSSKFFDSVAYVYSFLIDSSGSHWLDHTQKVDIRTYYREVLLTYRLLFGSRRSSAEFKTLAPSWAGTFFDSTTPESHHLPKYDPLIHILCCMHWQAPAPKKIYDAIRAGPLPANNNYSAIDHFQFLGTRLLDLQKYAKSTPANSFGSLWHDDRVTSDWWHLWASILISVRITRSN